jgi:hypothetical protein
MNNLHMKPKEIFLHGCNEIAKAFTDDGFKPLKKGQILHKNSADKDIVYEIYFQTSQRNWPGSVAVWPHCSIYSNELRKWETEHTEKEKPDGLIYHNTIGYISPYNCFKEYDLAGATFEKSILEITKDIKLYIAPIFEIFSDKDTAIEYLKNNGTRFNKWTDKSLEPMAFMIYFGGKETAEIFLKDFVESCKYEKSIKNYYIKLTKNENEVADFLEGSIIKIAYKNGIKI